MYEVSKADSVSSTKTGSSVAHGGCRLQRLTDCSQVDILNLCTSPSTWEQQKSCVDFRCPRYATPQVASRLVRPAVGPEDLPRTLLRSSLTHLPFERWSHLAPAAANIGGHRKLFCRKTMLPFGSHQAPLCRISRQPAKGYPQSGI